MAKAPANPADPFSGLTAEKAAEIKAYLEKELQGMEALLNEASKNDGEPVTVADAAGLPADAATVSNPDALMASVAAMHESTSKFIVAIESHARSAAQAADHAAHTDFSRLATVFGEFRNGLAGIIATK
jgi:hypothetical protein